MKRLLALVLLAVACGSPAPPPPRPRPSSAPGNALNVLLITIDTLRADHLSLHGYPRKTSPRLDELAAQGTAFEQASTYWPKTRGSFVMMMTGRLPSRNGYSKRHQALLEFNPTLAGVMQQAGYRTAALVDNPNVAAEHGYAKGFDSYRETWQERELKTEMDRTRAITTGAVAFLQQEQARPFFLWLHYVNPHAPYTPPAPFDTAFLPPGSPGPRLPVVTGFHGGIPRQWAVPGRDRLGYYVAQYDGEIAAVDQEVGRVLDALRAAGSWGKTLVVVTSDHGESLGEHDYYFDHGEDLFDPSLRIPLLVRLPGAPAALRPQALASTLDLVPTVLDAVKVSYPADLAGASLLPHVQGRDGTAAPRLFAQNDRNLSAAFDTTHKVVMTPTDSGSRFALYDRRRDPAETKDVSRREPEALRTWRRELELFLERADREWGQTRRLLEGVAGEGATTPEACEVLKSLGYVAQCSR